MSEPNPGKELPPQSNRVSDYVVKHVRRFEDLDGSTPEERERNFTWVLKSLVQRSRLGKQIGFGGSHDVFSLLHDKNVVVKKLKTEDYTSDAERDADWRSFQRDHATALNYFERRFILYTEFIDEVFTMVQERAQGEKYKRFGKMPPVSPQLKAEMIEFIRRYERMMREEGSVLQHFDRELMIDYDHAKITVLDTNGLVSLKEVMTNIPIRIFLKNFGINADSIRTTTDIH